MTNSVHIKEISPINAHGTINGKYWRAKIVGTTSALGPCRWSYRPDTLTKGERISIGRKIAAAEKATQ